MKLLSLLLLLSLTHAWSADDTPNIVFVLVDDMGYGDLAAHGNPLIHTPHMDRIHHESVRFTNFCVSPSCAPTRATLMSGKHEFKVDVSHTILGRNVLNLQAQTVANVLKSGGYTTGMFGKWHLGIQDGYRPDKRGFDVALTDVDDSQEHHYDPTLQRNGVEEKHQGYRTDIFFNQAMDFIESNQNKKFFCYIPTYSPHSPLIVPERYSKRYEGNPNKNFLGMVTNVDENIGRLRRKIEQLGLTDKTVFILMNDNGGTWGVDVHNAGMRGRKGSALYGGIRALSFWSWPGKWKPVEREQMTGHVDFLPTIAEIAGVKLEDGLKQSLDGVSLMSLIDGKAAQSDAAEILKVNDRMLVAHRARWSDVPGRTAAQNIQDHKYAYCCVRWKHYLLLRVQPCSSTKCSTCQKIHNRCKDSFAHRRPYTNNIKHYMAPENKWKLYDLKNDLFQTKDIADQQPAIVQKMAAHYEQWWMDSWMR
jgi:arylsulfatase A-like enzyme